MREKHGFSLVELLVVVAIVLILTGIGSFVVSNFNQTNKVVKLRDYISTRIKLAKNLAITNQLPEQDLGLEYVRVTINKDLLVVEGMQEGQSVGTTESPYFSEKLDGDTNIATTVFGFWGNTGRLTNENGEFSSASKIIIFGSGTTAILTVSDLGIIENGR
jgi:prepilin-type N-terminal cleavage/methylation domain-containing protein